MTTRRDVPDLSGQTVERVMRILRRRGWELPEPMVTPEAVVLRRRTLLAGASAIALAGGARADVQRNAKYPPGRAITDEKYATTYNNYYEFDDGKDLWRAAQVLKQRPWTISLEGMVKQPRTLDIDDLLKQVQLEERVYRHRCVEAWAMTVPWTGFPLGQLLTIAEPLGIGEIRGVRDGAGPQDARPAVAVLSVALYRGAGDRRGGERVGIHLHGAVRQATAATGWRPDPA